MFIFVVTEATAQMQTAEENDRATIVCNPSNPTDRRDEQQVMHCDQLTLRSRASDDITAADNADDYDHAETVSNGCSSTGVDQTARRVLHFDEPTTVLGYDDVIASVVSHRLTTPAQKLPDAVSPTTSPYDVAPLPHAAQLLKESGKESHSYPQFLPRHLTKHT